MTNRAVFLKWTLAFSIFISVILCVISLRFFEFMPEISSAKAALFISTGLFSHYVLICLLVYLSLWLVSFPLKFVPHGFKVLKVITLILAAAGCFLLVADTFVYTQYRFHISGFVVDMLLQGGSAIIDLSWFTWLITGLVGVICLVGIVALSRWANLVSQSGQWLRIKRIYLSAFFVSFFVSNGIHLFADATYDQSVTALVRHIPMFSPLTGKSTLLNSGLIDAESIRAERQNLSIKTSSELNYPKQPIVTTDNDESLNVLMIIVDSLRYDMLNDTNMPSVMTLNNGPNTLGFEQHISGGNSTRTGIFNLFYGLPGTYWNAFSSNQVSPVLMDTFLEHNYQPKIFAAAPLTKPAFDRTVFSKVTDLTLKTPGDSPWQRDENITEYWLDFVEQRAADPSNQTPFFGMLFYDGVHGFSVPENAESRFEPSWQRVDHLSLNADFDPTPYFNLYQNSVYQVDKQINRVLTQLRETGLLDNTIVIFTSDHGQEFNDNKQNYWGHGSNFTDVQVKVPFFVHWPGKAKANYTHRTSHSDLSVTLMEDLFNVTNSRADYSTGVHLFEEQRDSWTIIGSYVNYAIKESEQQTVTYPNGSYEILDNRGKPKENGKLATDIALKAMKQMSDFYQ
ncbi:DUF3413 domain-containing protein [Psychrosphaera sp. 1_MG-2023]|uniref:DUF3413 domain-containing protein n=1 Tax=Psychrosphaera sp. 1_MG-2023 TaxID=3062643 RepID=UPI0026E35D08|nr:DUF3413 domain-containing protein [Psychrosphaera sp. 1_MG-2023]MDO6721027.1 DUF3413 domain-containing protein [Psychrosphaera sp. 1_MG-2023]